MKLSTAAILFAPSVAAFAPSSFGTRRSTLQMSTEVETEAKVCIRNPVTK